MTVSKLDNRCIWVFFITILIRIINGHCCFILDFSFGYMKENWYISNYIYFKFQRKRKWLNRHEMDKYLICEQCAFSFSCTNEIESHMEVHIGEKLLDRSLFSVIGNLSIFRWYITTYTEDKSFGCSQCTESRSPRKSNCRIIYKFTQERIHFAAPSTQRHLL